MLQLVAIHNILMQPYFVIVSPCSSSPCLNAGICRNNGDSFSCTCTTGYTGLRCQTKRCKLCSGLGVLLIKRVKGKNRGQ